MNFKSKWLLIPIVLALLVLVLDDICVWMSGITEPDDEDWAKHQRNITSIVCGLASSLNSMINKSDAAQNFPIV